MQTAGEAPVDKGTQKAVRSLSSTRTVATSAMWNLIGRAGPLLVAVLVTPHLGPRPWPEPLGRLRDRSEPGRGFSASLILASAGR